MLVLEEALISLPFRNPTFYNGRELEREHKKSSFQIGVYCNDDNTNRITGTTMDESGAAVAR